MPALRLLPIIRVVQPAYQAGPKGGKGIFSAVGSRELSWVRVLRNSKG